MRALMASPMCCVRALTAREMKVLNRAFRHSNKVLGYECSFHIRRLRVTLDEKRLRNESNVNKTVQWNVRLFHHAAAAQQDSLNLLT